MRTQRTKVPVDELVAAAQRYRHPAQAARALEITLPAFHRLCRRHGVKPRGHGTTSEESTWRDDYLRGCATQGCQGHPLPTGYCIPCEVKRHKPHKGFVAPAGARGRRRGRGSAPAVPRVDLRAYLAPERRN